MGAFFLCAQLFLYKWKSEAVMINIIRPNSSSSLPEFIAAFKNDFDCLPTELLFSLSSKRLVELRLGDVRGKLMVITDIPGLTSGQGLPTMDSIWA